MTRLSYGCIVCAAIGTVFGACQRRAIPSQVVPTPAFREATLSFLEDLADSMSRGECKRVFIHPDVGKAWYSRTIQGREGWSSAFTLPVRGGETVVRDGMEIIFSPPPLDRPSDACLGLAAREWSPRDSSDRTTIFVEIFRPYHDVLGHVATAAADARMEANVWRISLTRIED